jgi:hypothetical protein
MLALSTVLEPRAATLFPIEVNSIDISATPCNLNYVTGNISITPQIIH